MIHDNLTTETFSAIIGPIPSALTLRKATENIRLAIHESDATDLERWISILRILDKNLRESGLSVRLGIAAIYPPSPSQPPSPSD